MPRSADLSVVVISLVGGEALARCIERLPPTGIEIVVVLKDAASDVNLWARRYPRIRFLPGRGEPPDEQRRRGIEATSGAVVGLIEDTSWPERGWCEAALAALADGKVVAAAGPVAIAPFLSDRCRARAWSAYGAFVPGAEKAPGRRLPGNAIALRRAALEAVVFEGDAVATDGEIAFDEGMKVTYSACAGASLSDRFRDGRRRGAATPASAPLARIGAMTHSIVRMFALAARDIRRVRRADRRTLTLPLVFWLALMEAAGAAGEAAGSLSRPADPGKTHP